MRSLRGLLNSYEPVCVQRLGANIPEWSRARGARVAGLIDFTSGLLTANVGHDNQAVRRAVAKSRGWNGWYAPNKYRLAAYETLRSILPRYLDRYLLFSSGSEAIDSVLRIVDDNMYTIVTDSLSYHGSTIGAQWVSGLRERTFSHLYMEPIRLASLDEVTRPAVLLETFQGPWCEWYEPKFIESLRQRQESGKLIVIFDEMQAGFGRCGTWFGFERYGIEPDIVVGGKAAAGGFPMAFVAGRARLMDSHPRADHVSTFSGNAPACAALVATVGEIKKRRLIEKVRANEGYITSWLEAMVTLGYGIRYTGRGYAYALHLDTAEEARAVVREALRRGLLLLDTGQAVVKIAPPLCIRKKDLLRGLNLIYQSIGAMKKCGARTAFPGR